MGLLLTTVAYMLQWKRNVVSEFVVHFTRHAREKFAILKGHKFSLSKDQVIDAVVNPDVLDRSRAPLLIAQKKISSTHVLRVVFRQENQNTIIITFYPGRRKDHEK